MSTEKTLTKLSEWVKSRGDSGEYGWRNIRTGAFTTSDPNTGQLQHTESTVSNTMRRLASNPTTQLGRYLAARNAAQKYNSKNYRPKTTNEMARIHPLYTTKAVAGIDTNGEPVVDIGYVLLLGPGGLVSAGNHPATAALTAIRSIVSNEPEQEGTELGDLTAVTFPIGQAFRYGYGFLPQALKVRMPAWWKNYLLDSEVKAGDYFAGGTPAIKSEDFFNDDATTHVSPLVSAKRRFVKDMDRNGYAFTSVQAHPKLKSVIEDNFIHNDGNVQEVIALPGSRPYTYAKWLNKRFGLFDEDPRLTVEAKPPSSFGEDIGGVYNTATGLASINMLYPSHFNSTFVHEGISHASDDIVADMAVTGNSPINFWPKSAGDFLRSSPFSMQNKTVSEAYKDIASILPSRLREWVLGAWSLKSIKPRLDITEASREWYEARATLNEVRADLLARGFTDLNPPDKTLLNTIGRTNSYGSDYIRAYNKLSPEKQKVWLNKVRWAINNLPAVGGAYWGYNLLTAE